MHPGMNSYCLDQKRIFGGAERPCECGPRLTMKPLNKKRMPEEGETVLTEYGEATISRILFYDDVIDEMRQNGISQRKIERFNICVEHFLGKTDRYFECELNCSDNEIRRIDWSEYDMLIKKNKK
jgi:hypothetical protein